MQLGAREWPDVSGSARKSDRNEDVRFVEVLKLHHRGLGHRSEVRGFLTGRSRSCSGQLGLRIAIELLLERFHITAAAADGEVAGEGFSGSRNSGTREQQQRC